MKEHKMKINGLDINVTIFEGDGVKLTTSINGADIRPSKVSHILTGCESEYNGIFEGSRDCFEGRHIKFDEFLTLAEVDTPKLLRILNDRIAYLKVVMEYPRIEACGLEWELGPEIRCIEREYPDRAIFSHNIPEFTLRDESVFVCRRQSCVLPAIPQAFTNIQTRAALEVRHARIKAL